MSLDITSISCVHQLSLALLVAMLIFCRGISHIELGGLPVVCKIGVTFNELGHLCWVLLLVWVIAIVPELIFTTKCFTPFNSKAIGTSSFEYCSVSYHACTAILIKYTIHLALAWVMKRSRKRFRTLWIFSGLSGFGGLSSAVGFGSLSSFFLCKDYSRYK
jgi:hypothetical protein